MEDGWLDLQTLEMLHHEPPPRIAPPTLPDYSVVMLEVGGDRERMVRAVRRTNNCSDSEARALLARRLPLVVNLDLSYHDAGLGPFELVCCDAISVIMPSEVVANAEPTYLKDLYARLRQSDEFQKVTLRLESLPWGEDAIRFLGQFLGLAEVEAKAQQFPVDLRMFHKKARIMAHWGDRIGAEVRVTVSPRDE